MDRGPSQKIAQHSFNTALKDIILYEHVEN